MAKRDMTTWFLAPNGRWSARNLVGDAAVNATLRTYQAGTRTPKATAASSAGIPLNPTTILLDSKGEYNIYWDDDSYYYIELYDVNGNLIYTQDNYPVVGSGGSNTVNNYLNKPNFVRNSQYTFWTNGTSFTNLGTNSLVADDWYFKRSNTNASVSVSRATFNLGQTDVEGNPIYYLHYECTATGGGGETLKQLTQSYKSVQMLAGKEVSFSIAGMSSTSSTIIIELEQFFGTGGSPSAGVLTTVLTFPLTPTWETQNATITLPNVNGKTLGSNGDDELRLNIKYPLNAIANIDVVNTRLVQGNTITDFSYYSYEEQFGFIKQLVNNALFKTSDFKLTLRDSADEGWVMCDDGTIGSYASSATNRANDDAMALYTHIWNKVVNDFAPVQTSAGVPTTRGANATADWNANKRLSLTRTLGRVLAAAGTGGYSIQFAADESIETFTCTSTHAFYTGTPITVSTTGTLPNPLMAATTYYAIYLTATTFKLATSLANALAGTAIDITTNGTGIQTASYTLGTFALGQPMGEDSHVLTTAEMPAHTHTWPYNGMEGTGPGSGSFSTGGALNQTTSSTGGNGAHNNIQPTTFVTVMLKL